jgi:hypothetical protein
MGIAIGRFASNQVSRIHQRRRSHASAVTAEGSHAKRYLFAFELEMNREQFPVGLPPLNPTDRQERKLGMPNRPGNCCPSPLSILR